MASDGTEQMHVDQGAHHAVQQTLLHTKLDTPIRPPLYTDEQVIRYVQMCNQHMAPMTFNVGIYQDGTLASISPKIWEQK